MDKLRNRVSEWLARSTLANDAIPIMLSFIIGLATGLGAFLFIRLLSLFGDIAGRIHEMAGSAGLIAGMSLAGLLTGLIVAKFAPEAKGHGVPEVMEAIAIKRGRIRPRVALAKIVASAITIGSGGSAGREGPIVQVGSALGSTFGQLTRLADEQRIMLVASGAAAGIAATFNAPIAGSMFAMEIILGHFSNRYLGIVVVSAVSANVISRSLLGENPAFLVPVYKLNSPLELPLYIIVGVLCALAAIGFIRMLYAIEYVAANVRIPLPVITTIGMALAGIIGVLAPESMGPGLEYIGESVAQDMDIHINLMLKLLALKLLATTLTLGTGNSGGVFAPALFMGAMIGGVIGQLGQSIWPEIMPDPGAFALVGMAAMFAGAARSPLTAIVIVLEMSNDYRLILPLLMTVMISTLIADFLHPDTIYTLKLTLRGIHLESGQDVDLLQTVRVEEVISKNYETVLPDMPLAHVYDLFNETHHHGFPIVDGFGQLRGMITLRDMERAHKKPGYENMTVIEAGTTENLVTVFPKDPIYEALKRMNVYGIGRMPVVVGGDSRRYLGMIRRSDILRAYDVGLKRKSIEQHRQSHYKLREVQDQKLVEFTVEPDAPMDGHVLADFPCSDHCLVVAVIRNDKTMLPHGQTLIRAGDRVTAYITSGDRELVLDQFTTPDEKVV